MRTCQYTVVKMCELIVVAHCCNMDECSTEKSIGCWNEQVGLCSSVVKGFERSIGHISEKELI